MDAHYLQLVVQALGSRGVTCEPGLTDAEVARIETTYGFRFPPDLRAFLQYALPVSDPVVPPGAITRANNFPNWRHEPETSIRERLEWPLEGIRFDIEHNGFWLDSWGEMPTDRDAAFDVARREVNSAPTLIPIFSHRYLPSEPPQAGNPVLSVYQTDIIYYGYDLAGYFAAEFGCPSPAWASETPRGIGFWDELLLRNSPDLADAWQQPGRMKAFQETLIRWLQRWR